MASGHQDTKPISARGLRVEERRRAIAAKASQGILREGYEGLSVNKLADDVGLSVGGLYRYISQKSDLLVMACEDIYGGLFEKISNVAVSEKPVADKLTDAISIYFRVCSANEDQILLMYREYRHLPSVEQSQFQEREHAIAEIFENLIRSGVEERVFETTNSELLALDIIVLGHLPALKGWAMRSLADPAESIPAQIAIIINSLRPK